MQPPADQTCSQYLSAFATAAGGQITNPNDTANCAYCPLTTTDQYLNSVAISYSTRWRDYGIVFAYIFFNIFAAIALYYTFRVRKGSGKSIGEKLKPVLGLFKKDPEAEKSGKAKADAPQSKA